MAQYHVSCGLAAIYAGTVYREYILMEREGGKDE